MRKCIWLWEFTYKLFVKVPTETTSHGWDAPWVLGGSKNSLPKPSYPSHRRSRQLRLCVCHWVCGEIHSNSNSGCLNRCLTYLSLPDLTLNCWWGFCGLGSRGQEPKSEETKMARSRDPEWRCVRVRSRMSQGWEAEIGHLRGAKVKAQWWWKSGGGGGKGNMLSPFNTTHQTAMVPLPHRTQNCDIPINGAWASALLG